MISHSLSPRVFSLPQEIDISDFWDSTIQPYSINLDDSTVKCYRKFQLVEREPYTSIRQNSIDQQPGAKSESFASHIIEEKFSVQDEEPLMLILELQQ